MFIWSILQRPSKCCCLSVWGPSFSFFCIVLPHTPSLNEFLELLSLWHTVKSHTIKYLQKSVPSWVWRCFIWTFSPQPTCSSKRRETEGWAGNPERKLLILKLPGKWPLWLPWCKIMAFGPGVIFPPSIFTEAKESRNSINLRPLSGHQAPSPSRSSNAGQLQAPGVHVLCWPHFRELHQGREKNLLIRKYQGNKKRGWEIAKVTSQCSGAFLSP